MHPCTSVYLLYAHRDAFRLASKVQKCLVIWFKILYVIAIDTILREP